WLRVGKLRVPVIGDLEYARVPDAVVWLAWSGPVLDDELRRTHETAVMHTISEACFPADLIDQRRRREVCTEEAWAYVLSLVPHLLTLIINVAQRASKFADHSMRGWRWEHHLSSVVSDRERHRRIRLREHLRPEVPQHRVSENLCSLCRFAIVELRGDD